MLQACFPAYCVFRVMAARRRHATLHMLAVKKKKKKDCESGFLPASLKKT